MNLTYVLPIRWDTDEDPIELTHYLVDLAPYVDLIVVDGSPASLFERHHRLWAAFCTHVPPDPDLGFANGKVDGVHTGVRCAAFEHVVIADDDVRYDLEGLAAVARLLGEGADLVRPQNYFDPTPWHALWDTARSLMNRTVARDWPGTFGMRRSMFVRMGGYDGDVLFENLELVRTVEAAGGRVVSPLDLFVRRLPPQARRFWSQRVRQAYDEFARPSLLAIWLSVLPAGVLLAAVAPRVIAGAAGVTIGLAEVGRRRRGGHRVFPPAASLFAPLWVLERAVTTWFAVTLRLSRGGIAYAGRRLRRAATPARKLRRRLPDRTGLPTPTAGIGGREEPRIMAEGPPRFRQPTSNRSGPATKRTRL